MQTYKVVLTWEAIYDIAEIADYIEKEFGQDRADRFQLDIEKQIHDLSHFGKAFLQTHILYRGYYIHRKSIPPSIIFYVIAEQTHEIHVLRVLRHERDWQNILARNSRYTYPVET